MDAEQMRDYCLAKPGAWPDWPWGGGPDAEDGQAPSVAPELPVIKVVDRIFAFLWDGSVGVKGAATRDVADEWLHRYPEDAQVMAYRGRSGWNELAFGGSIPDEDLREAVDESYRLVVGKMPKKNRPSGWEAGP
jgi:predicted DNA-binding protein (MmcQ/YjbR family)